MLQNSIMDTFLVIVSLIATVLNIILFFKVWGMTDDVKKIRKRFINKSEDLSYTEIKSELNKYIIKKDKEGAKTFLTDCLLTQLATIPLESSEYRYYYSSITRNYAKYFDLIGEKLPYRIDLMECADFREMLKEGLK